MAEGDQGGVVSAPVTAPTYTQATLVESTALVFRHLSGVGEVPPQALMAAIRVLHACADRVLALQPPSEDDMNAAGWRDGDMDECELPARRMHHKGMQAGFRAAVAALLGEE
jgi:hypothetical protein